MSEQATGLPDVPLYRAAKQIDGYDNIEAILKDGTFGAFNDRVRHEFLGDTLVHLDGERHRNMRLLHQKLFRRDALDFYEREYIVPAIERAIRELGGRRGADGTVRDDLIAITRATLSDMGCRLIGLGDLEDDARRSRYMELAGLILGGIMLDTSTAAPAARDAQLAEARRGMGAFLDEFVRPAIKRHRTSPATSADVAFDLIALLLADDPAISDELVLRNCCLYISGSQGAVIQSIAHTFDNLCRWLAEEPGRSADAFDVEFLRQAVDETLRLTPPQGILTRVAGAGKTLPGGEVVAEGELVALRLGDAHQDAAIFGGCPHSMVPGRAPTRERVAPFGLAFGTGRHVCIGRRFALAGGEAEDGASEGIMLRLLQALYGAGMAPDPEDAPVLAQNARGHFERYPVIFHAV